MELLTGVDNVSVSGDVGEGLRAVLLDPRNGSAVGGAGNDDVLALVVGFQRRVVIVSVDVHRSDYLCHGHPTGLALSLSLSLRIEVFSDLSATMAPT